MNKKLKIGLIAGGLGIFFSFIAFLLIICLIIGTVFYCTAYSPENSTWNVLKDQLKPYLGDLTPYMEIDTSEDFNAFKIFTVFKVFNPKEKAKQFDWHLMPNYQFTNMEPICQPDFWEKLDCVAAYQDNRVFLINYDGRTSDDAPADNSQPFKFCDYCHYYTTHSSIIHPSTLQYLIEPGGHGGSYQEYFYDPQQKQIIQQVSADEGSLIYETPDESKTYVVQMATPRPFEENEYY
ncbi:MAG: hypothetical protein IKU10_00335, partial [Clostridia bacterium]|nr:hypothetical protein [Clostridia bacterium]